MSDDHGGGTAGPRGSSPGAGAGTWRLWFERALGLVFGLVAATNVVMSADYLRATVRATSPVGGLAVVAGTGALLGAGAAVAAGGRAPWIAFVTDLAIRTAPGAGGLGAWPAAVPELTMSLVFVALSVIFIPAWRRTAATADEATNAHRLAHALLTDDDLVGHLAPREIQVFELLAQGVVRADIGRLMDPPAATSTVDTYLKRAARTYRSLGRPTFNAYETLQHVIRDGHVDGPGTDHRPGHAKQPNAH